jgi:hypothetical protein
MEPEFDLEEMQQFGFIYTFFKFVWNYIEQFTIQDLSL